MPQVRRQHRGSEGNDNHTEHEDEVEDQQHVVAPLDVGKQTMVIDPHDADEGKADKKREIRWPLAQQLRAQVAVVARNFDLEDEQGNSNGKHAIRKSLNSRSLSGQSWPLVWRDDNPRLAVRYSHPVERAMRAASVRLAAPNLLMASDR